MPVITDPAGANAAIFDIVITLLPLAAAGNVRPEVVDRIREVGLSPIIPEATSSAVEIVYAQKDELPEEVKSLAADLCQYVTTMLWYGFGQNQKGLKIMQVLRGETVEDAPAPNPQFVVPQPVPEE